MQSKADNVFAVNYSLRWLLQKELADFNKELGCFVSAFELLNEVELTEDSILCLFLAGRETQAIKAAEMFLQESLDATPEKTDKKKKAKNVSQANVLCLLGDMKRDETYYERAWEESGEKCARAMRSLGRAWFNKGQWEKAIECFLKALAINRLYKDTWFTCGCAHMRLEQWEKAIFSFGNVVSIDESAVDAWGNIANCYHVQEKLKEALACTEQALKFNRKNWMIWHNCIRFCIADKQFYKACTCVRELIR